MCVIKLMVLRVCCITVRYTKLVCSVFVTYQELGKWADPGGTAMPGQPVTRPEQAPEPHPLAKISLISKGAHGPRIRY